MYTTIIRGFLSLLLLSTSSTHVSRSHLSVTNVWAGERERKKQNKSTFSMNFNQGKSGKRAKKSRYIYLYERHFVLRKWKQKGGRLNRKCLFMTRFDCLSWHPTCSNTSPCFCLIVLPQKMVITDRFGCLNTT